MPKSKEFIDSSGDESDNGKRKRPTTTKKTEATKAPTKTDPPAKRAKTEANGSKASSADTSSTGINGEKRYELGKMRHISVSEFKNKPYVNIREYYYDKDGEKPGKKGISLSTEQWQKLKTFVNQIDKDLKEY
ncbi:unnamed protein product [Didymodactylos carnosus]|uniref:Transcriptional coactivator p15 (PC4) C-terminal domain-containing protein n=1 Tax=Didymodactylos carnosus TaxID=1234261 RepID=A0A813S943_9BILA|nr:unnamed protein product [Didymodactylos carnosus]CAF1607863.1 unnamed protein product [Didymodactylos carnosus]CAF3576159.1 unnamed protein product [Didymodactylos carnosus]CAF4419856.1 unnamed protein product [Didymodactylos carnosus]